MLLTSSVLFLWPGFVSLGGRGGGVPVASSLIGALKGGR